jgi:ABC-type transport system involved in multi-copper enzyme maturation permease subunit
MNLLRPEVELLFWKEIRQLTRNQAAMLTGLFLPAALVVLAPVLALLASRSPTLRGVHLREVSPGLIGLFGMTSVQDWFLFVTLPLLFTLAGLLTPTLIATYTVVSERERHTLDLLVALPVTLTDVLTAKLVANLVTGLAIIVPMFAVDAVMILTLTPVGPPYVIGALLLLVSALVAAMGGGLVQALWARDFRTSNYVTAALAVPPLFVTALCVVFVPGSARLYVLAVLMLGLGYVAYNAAKRWLTFERYLS